MIKKFYLKFIIGSSFSCLQTFHCRAGSGLLYYYLQSKEYDSG